MVRMLEEIDIGDAPVEEVIDRARARELFVFDLETTGLNCLTDRIEGVAIYVPDGEKNPPLRAWYPFVEDTMLMYVQPDETPEEQFARVRYERTSDKLDKLAWEQLKQKPAIQNLRPAMPQREVMEKLRPLFETYPDLIGSGHHLKFDVGFLVHSSGADRGFQMNLKLADSMLLDFLGDENQFAYGLKGRVEQLFGHKMVTYEEAARLKRQQVLPFMADQVQPLGAYAMEDVFWTWRLFEHAMERIQAEDETGRLERIFWNIDMKICRILNEMECAGVLIDWRWLKDVSKRLEAEKDEILTRIEQRVGYTLNPKSAPQVSTLLFGPKEQGSLGLSTKAVKQGKGGMFSTGSKEIGHLRRAGEVKDATGKIVEHSLVADILDWRSLDTVNANFAIKIARLAQESPDGRVRSHFNQTNTVIARLSCVAYDVPVEILRDASISPKGVPIRDVKPGDWAYTYDDKLKLTLRRVKGVWKTGTREVVRVHWMRQGNGSITEGYLDVTPEHPIRRVDGSYAPAETLQPGERVLALSRRIDDYGYADLYATRHGRVQREHRFVYETLTGRRVKKNEVVHHEDENKLNNVPSNLKLETRREHGSKHARQRWDRLTLDEKTRAVSALNASWSKPGRKKKHSQQLKQMWKDGKFEKPQGEKHPRYEDLTFKWLDEKFAECGSAYAVCKKYGMNYYRLLSAMTRLEFVPNNHIITKVERTGRVVDVYDLEIEGTHNFIAGELCVHNSSDPFNFQNQPRDRNLIRKAFCSHYPDEPELIARIADAAERKVREDELMLLFGVDYSQIELRVAAHLSGDKNMIEVYSSIGGCKACEGKPCPRYLSWICDDCDKKDKSKDRSGSVYLPIIQPGQKDPEQKCPRCGSAKVKHQKRCRHVDLHQRTSEDVSVERDPLAKCLDGRTLLSISVDGKSAQLLSIKGIFNAACRDAVPGDHCPVYDGASYEVADGRGGMVRLESGLVRPKRPTKIVVTKRAVVVATDDHRFQVIGDGLGNLTPDTRGYKHVAGLSLVEAAKLEKGMKLPLGEAAHPRAMEPEFHREASYCEARLNPFTKEIGDGPATLVLDEKWAYFAGMFAGDGCASGNACVITHGHTTEYEGWRQTVRAACDAVGLPTSVSGDKRNTRIGSRVVRRYLSALGLCREKEHRSGEKIMEIPGWVLSGGPRVAWSYLAGLFDTDGTVGRARAGTASVTTKYPEFAGQIAMLLRWLGMPILVQPGYNKTYDRWYYTIHVLGEGLARFQVYCPLRRTDKVTRLTERNEQITRRCAPGDDEVILVLDGGEREVYDFHVENDDHLYLQGGLVGHNNLNFGSLYRIGPDRFCQYADLYDENGDPRVEYAAGVIKGWFDAYPGIKPFHAKTEQHLRENKWIAQTLTGRRRRLAQARYIEGEYRAITQGIQFQVSGTSQDIIKMAMIRIIEDRDARIAKAAGPAERRAWSKMRILIQVHDELVGVSPSVIRHEVKALVDHRMKTAASLRVPLDASTKFGQSWDDTH